MGAVGRGGSVSDGENPSRSWVCSRRTALSAVLKIRVSVVRFRPWPPPPIFLKRNGFPASPADYRRAPGRFFGRPSDYRKSGRSRGAATRWPTGRQPDELEIWNPGNLRSVCGTTLNVEFRRTCSGNAILIQPRLPHGAQTRRYAPRRGTQGPESSSSADPGRRSPGCYRRKGTDCGCRGSGDIGR